MPVLVEIEWSVRRSFVRYVAGLPDALVTAALGARALSSDGPWVFRPDPVATAHDVYATNGAVSFRGHGGLLQVDLANLWVHRKDGALRLSISDPVDASGRIVIARAPWGAPALPNLDVGDVFAIDIELTADGSALFGDTYPEGEFLDPLCLRAIESQDDSHTHDVH